MNVEGMKPLNLLSFKWRIAKEVLKFPKQFGSDPSKLLFDRYRILRDLKLQMDEGISPLKLLDCSARLIRPD